MEAQELALLIESIDTLTNRFSWLTGFLYLAYFTILGGIYFSYWRSPASNKPTELRDADLMLEQAKYEELFKISHRVLKRRPNNVEAHWYIALCYYYKSNYSKATDYFLKTKKANPGWVEVVDVYLNYIEELEQHTPLEQQH